MLSGKLFRRVVDYYEKSNLDRILNTKTLEDIDARALYNFSFKELKKHISPEVWSKIVKENPLYDIPEFYEINDFEDVVPHFHHTLPHVLSRPAIMLTDIQRAAKKMTLEYMKKETELINKRARAMTEFPVMTLDRYEVDVGLMIVREPIWLLHDEEEYKWINLHYKVLGEHGRIPSIKAKDFPFARDPMSGDDERSIRMRSILRKFENNEDLKFKPYEKPSIHWLEADPYETNPRSISYAGGYRVWLMLKERKTGKWVFPTAKMYGTHTFSDGLGKINNELLEARILYNMVGPTPCLVDVYNFEKPKVVDRPRLLSEDVYDLYFKRTKLLFENSDDATIENYLNKRYKMTRNTSPKTLETQGVKTFFYRAIYKQGIFDVTPNSYYEDWAWVPKLELNKYIEEDRYNRYVKVMSLT